MLAWQILMDQLMDFVTVFKMEFGVAFMKISKIFGVAAVSAMVAACGGGSGSSSGSGGGSQTPQDIEGLTMPQSMSVVSSSTEVAGMRTSAMKRLLKMFPQNYKSMSYDGAETEYSTDEVNTFVWDESMESLDIINEIMCYIGQTGYKEMVNQDPYLALINGSECRKSGSSSSQNDQSSGSNATSYETWTISSTRESNTAAQVVNIWFPEVDERTGQPDGYMRVQTIVSDGVSDEMPFGSFTLNFEFYNDSDEQTGGGVLKTTTPPDGSPAGAVAFMFYESGAETEEFNIGGPVNVTFVHTTQIMVVFDDADGNSGVAVIKRENTVSAEDNPTLNAGQISTAETWLTNNMNKTYDVAFNGTHFYSAVYQDRAANPLVVDDESCLDRNEFDTQVWRYNLYYKEGSNAGSRVDINSGFPFKAQAGDNTVFGHIGYWGIWVPYGTDLTAITTLVRENFGGSSSQDPQEYTLVQAPGKMIKSTKTEVALADIEGLALSWWPWIPPECTDQNSEITCEGVSQISEGSDYIVEYTADTTLSLAEQGDETVASAGFYAIATRTWGDQGESLTYLPTPVKVSIPWFNFFSNQLGGSVSYPFVNDQGAEDPTKATIFVETFVNGADSAFAQADTITLHCFQECLKGEISQNEIDGTNSESPFYTSVEQEWNENGPIAPTVSAASYTFDKATLTLTVASVAGDDSHEDVGKVVRLGTAQSPITPGSTSQYSWGIQSQAMLTSIDGLETVWDTWNSDVSYRWETGANSWNIYSAVKDANGDYVQFDAPIQMLYKHSDSNDMNWEDGDQQTAYHDVTYKLEYGGDGELWGFPWEEDQTTGRWSNPITLKDGTTLTDGTTNYVVKGIEREQSMVEEGSAATCTDNVTPDVDLVLPTSNDVDGITQDMATYANKPVVTDAPAVIEGEVQIVIE